MVSYFPLLQQLKAILQRNIKFPAYCLKSRSQSAYGKYKKERWEAVKEKRWYNWVNTPVYNCTSDFYVHIIKDQITDDECDIYIYCG